MCVGTVCATQFEREGVCAHEMCLGRGGMMWCVCAEGWVVGVCTRLGGVCGCAVQFEREGACAHEMCSGSEGNDVVCVNRLRELKGNLIDKDGLMSLFVRAS